MKENETLKINPLPSKTWYWLHLNDTTVKWNGDVQPCMVMAEEPEQVSEAGLNIKEMTTGVGAEADAIFEDENLPILQFTAKAEAGDRVIRLNISSEDKENAAGTVYIAAEENALRSLHPAKRLRAIWHSEQNFMLGKTARFV